MNHVSPTVESARPLADPAARLPLRRWAIGFLILAALAIPLDVFVASCCRINAANGKSKIPSDLRKLLSLSEVFGHGAGIALILISVCVLDRQRRRQLPYLIAFPVVAGVTANAAKMLVARVRPGRFDLSANIADSFAGWLPMVSSQAGESRFDWGLQSFPSGHTAAAVGLAIGLSQFYPHGRWWFATLAALVALQRIDANAHWPSDTLFAAALACGTSFLITRWTWLKAKCGVA